MTTSERQALRLKILKQTCEILDYDLNKSILQDKIPEIYKDIDLNEVTKQLMFLGEKGYLKITKIAYQGEEYPGRIRLNTSSIDLIERIESNNNIDAYENDFSKDSIVLYGNITNSQVIMNSANSNIIISQNDSSELIIFFINLKEKNKDNNIIQNLSERVVSEIKKGSATKEYLKGIGQTLLSIGTSVYANLITPIVANLLGIPNP